MHIGCDTINCNIIDTAIVRVDNITIKPIQLKYCTKGGQVTLPIFLAPVQFLNLIPSFGSTTFVTGLKTGQQITIRTYGQINSNASGNVITYFLLDGGNIFNSNILPSIAWQPFDSVVFETRLTMISPGSALVSSNYSKNGGTLVSYLGSSVIQTINPVDLAIALQSTSACDFKHYYTEILATA
jgi:hypothetical protein